MSGINRRVAATLNREYIISFLTDNHSYSSMLKNDSKLYNMSHQTPHTDIIYFLFIHFFVFNAWKTNDRKSFATESTGNFELYIEIIIITKYNLLGAFDTTISKTTITFKNSRFCHSVEVEPHFTWKYQSNVLTIERHHRPTCFSLCVCVYVCVCI